MVYDLARMTSAAEAQVVLAQAKPNYVIFAAGKSTSSSLCPTYKKAQTLTEVGKL